jgi:hypothetical protein
MLKWHQKLKNLNKDHLKRVLIGVKIKAKEQVKNLYHSSHIVEVEKVI